MCRISCCSFSQGAAWPAPSPRQTIDFAPSGRALQRSASQCQAVRLQAVVGVCAAIVSAWLAAGAALAGTASTRSPNTRDHVATAGLIAAQFDHVQSAAMALAPPVQPHPQPCGADGLRRQTLTCSSAPKHLCPHRHPALCELSRAQAAARRAAAHCPPQQSGASQRGRAMHHCRCGRPCPGWCGGQPCSATRASGMHP